jgi:molybdopterin/thiamine biosynthesis adenylyltransferase
MSDTNKPLLYSRQTRILGSNSIQSLSDTSVLVINLNGIGAETGT